MLKNSIDCRTAVIHDVAIDDEVSYEKLLKIKSEKGHKLFDFCF